jgi:hypothetical protein
MEERNAWLEERIMQSGGGIDLIARGGFYFPEITSQHPQVLCLVEGS